MTHSTFQQLAVLPSSDWLA